MKNRSFRILALIMAISMLLPNFATAQVQVPAGGSEAPAAQTDGAGTEPGEKSEVRTALSNGAEPAVPAPATAQEGAPQPIAQSTLDKEAATQKLDANLSELSRTAVAGEQDAVLIRVYSRGPAAVDAYFVDGKFVARAPIDMGDYVLHSYVGFAYPTNLLKLAGLGQVEFINSVYLERTASPEPYPADDTAQLPERGPADWAALRENAAALRSGAQALDFSQQTRLPDDWFEVMPVGPHEAQVAWERGFTGEGVTVAVLDDGIDAAHPDLVGTQKIYSSTVAPQYNGWPMVFSPFSQLIYFYDDYYGTTYIADQYYNAVHYVDTSTTPDLVPCGTGLILCFDYTPVDGPGIAHTYVVDDAMSQSDVVHVGTHPDNDLRDFIWGEKPAVLVADPNVAGVYDTVYVDLNDNYDFRDDQPLKRADVNDPGTYNDMISGLDLTGDGLADISGGMLYFIGDGATPIPGSDVIWYPFVPGNGDLVAFSGGTFDGPYSHGTQCASNVVGQGVTDGMLPEFRDLPGGTADGAVYGMAPDAEMVNVSDIYWDHTNSTLDAYLFVALGYDGIPSSEPADTDGIQITSNSYGSSSTDNDGWDYRGQVVSEIQRNVAPFTQYLFSTGNGAPAYGTTSPPSPATGISIGASTEFGSTGWDSITDTTQIMFNDVTPFSNRGPGARGTQGVDVVAGGAFAAGAEELNYYSASTWGAPDGNLSWVSWGGTSRSAPVAMGVLALIYQAYYEDNGVWPTYEQAKALYMSTATDLNYDVFTQGSGSANADRGTAVAGGLYGVYAMPSDWQPGDYRGEDYPGFAHITYPGDEWTQEFEIMNTGDTPVTVDIDDSELMLIDSAEFDFTITPEMIAAEDDNFYKAFTYMIPITAAAGFEGADPDWYNIDIPADTDLMIVRQMFPYDDFDANGDYNWDHRVYLMVYNWQDTNGDGDVWEDKDGNGVVNFVNANEITLIDYGTELEWDDPITELDRWEYGRFSYHRPGGNRNEMWVHDPLERMIDGLFIGLRHLPRNADGFTLSYRIDFYRKEDVTWLSTDVSSLEIPAGSSASFVATADVPLDIPAGIYQAAIQIHDPGWMEYDADTSVIPVTLDVAAPFEGGMQLGGADSYAYDADRPYNNAAVRGLFDWTWRAESGDWRFFFSDVENCEEDVCLYEEGDKILVRDQWEDVDGVAPYNDIDTIVLGPTPSSLGSGWYDWPDPGFYGPYVLDTVGKSPNMNVAGGTWIFDTTSGANEDWVTAPLPDWRPDRDGLHEFLQHNVIHEGLDFDVVFTKTVGTLSEDIHSFAIDTYLDAGTVGTVTLESTMDLNGIVAESVLFEVLHDTWDDEPLDFIDDSTIEWVYQFSTQDAIDMELWTSSSDISDIDLFLFHWTGTDWAQMGSSTSSDASEEIYLANPPDGYWIIGVLNWSGPAGHFDLDLVVRSQIGELQVSGATGAPVPADTPVPLTIGYDYPMTPGSCYEGLVFVGPPEAPYLKEIPVSICRLPGSGMIQKEVDWETAFPGMQLDYTVDLFNLSDAEADWEFSDPIPDGTEFVSLEGEWCEILPGSTPVLTENFDAATPPDLPAGWAEVDVSGTSGNWDTRTSTRYPSGYEPHSAPNLAYFNSWTASSGYSTRLYQTAGLDMSAERAAQVSFWMFHDTGYAGTADRVQVQVSTDGGASWTDAGSPIVRYDGTTGWAQHFVDISEAAAQQADVRIGFLGISGWGNDVHIDDVEIAVFPFVCHAPVYDAINNQVVYTGTLPLGTASMPAMTQGFEAGVMPPPDWDVANVNGPGWEIVDAVTYPDWVHGGSYAAMAYWDGNVDVWLSSPWFTVDAGDPDLTFWAYSATDYTDGTPVDGHNVQLHVIGDGFDDIVWDMQADEYWYDFAYREVSVSLAAYAGQDVYLAWNYLEWTWTGYKGIMAMDDIVLPGDTAPVYTPSLSVNIKVEILETTQAGVWITNTAELAATHFLPQEDQMEAPVMASAYTHIGMEDFLSSYKTAPDTAVPGEVIAYEIHVINSGDAVASVTLTDTIPAGTTLVDWDDSTPYQNFGYNAAEGQMEWSGNIAPGEEWTFTYWVEIDDDMALWGTTIANTAYVSWDGNMMPLMAETDIVPPYQVFLPLVVK